MPKKKGKTNQTLAPAVSSDAEVSSPSPNILQRFVQVPDLGSMLCDSLTHVIKDESNLSALVEASSDFYHFFQPQRIKEKLLQYVVEGDMEKVSSLCEIDPSCLRYLTMRGCITDDSGRMFDHISAFEYMVWSLDWSFLERILALLDKPTASDSAHQQAVSLRREFLTQYLGVKEGRINYQYEGKEIRSETHFSLNPLLNVLSAYLENYDDWTLDEKKHHWLHVVPEEQLKLPNHFIMEYHRVDLSIRPISFLIPLSPAKKIPEYWAEFGGNILAKEGFGSKSSGYPPPIVISSHSFTPNDLTKIRNLYATRLEQLKDLEQELRVFPKKEVVRPRITKDLLVSVAVGREQKAEKLLSLNIYHLVNHATIEDYSGRVFTNISPFEYAVWALDIPMINMMVNHLQDVATGEYEKAEMVRKIMLRQYLRVKAFD